MAQQHLHSSKASLSPRTKDIMINFLKWIFAATVSVAVLLAMTTLRWSDVLRKTRATPYLDNAVDRNLPLSLLSSLLEANFSGFGGFGGGGGNSTPGQSSALKLYWELGYYWQEETIEREWCMACDGGCSEGNRLRTTRCDSTSLPPAQMIINEDTIIPVNIPVDLVQIEVAGTGLCLEAVPENDVIFLSTCQNFVLNQNQWFFGYNETYPNRFEIKPFIEPDQCVTQLHHPKDGEEIIIQFCDISRIDNTTYWEKYPDPPTDAPRSVPTTAPSASPSSAPSSTPSSAPSGMPSASPSSAPSVTPSDAPSGTPAFP